jgi:fatty acid desaturase
LRKIQHWIFFVPFSFLFALWRVDTLKVAVDSVELKRPDAKGELWYLLAHYFALLTFFPFEVWVPAVFVSGLMSALIVTPTHQSEEMFEEYQPDWVTAQFRSTRNAVMTNPFSEWLWGGMQYQLEHHLFPSMPR